MSALQQYGEACNALAKAFIINKIGIEDWDERSEYMVDGVSKLDMDEYFIGSEDTDYGMFSDGSDYYHWRITDMFIILQHNIPYDIATEHFDWQMDKSSGDYDCNLKHYYFRRKNFLEMTAADFQRHISRLDYLDRADRLTDKYIAESEAQLQVLRDKFEEDMKEYKNNK